MVSFSLKFAVHQLPHEFSNGLKLKTFGKKKMLGKSQNWVEAEHTAHSLFQKENFGNGSLKLSNSRDQNLLVYRDGSLNLSEMNLWQKEFMLRVASVMPFNLFLNTLIWNKMVSPTSNWLNLLELTENELAKFSS